MAPSAMLPYLAAVARQAREAKGRKPYNIASAEPGMPGADPSTVWRFEQGESWPQNADHMINLYAADLEIEPIELWTRALALWRAEGGGVTAPAPGAPPDAGLGGLVDRLTEADQSPPETAPAPPKSRPAARPRRRA